MLTLLGLEAVPMLGAVWLCSLALLALFVETQVCWCCEGCEGMVSGCMKEQLKLSASFGKGELLKAYA